MICLQDLFCFLNVRIIFGTFIPWQLQQRLDIAAFHSTFRGICADSFVSCDFFFDPLFYRVICLQLFQFFPEHFRIRFSILFPQLLAYVLQLLPEYIFSLVFLYLFLDFLIQFIADRHDLDLFLQERFDIRISVPQGYTGKHLLFFCRRNLQIHSKLIHKMREIFHFLQMSEHTIAFFLHTLQLRIRIRQLTTHRFLR